MAGFFKMWLDNPKMTAFWRNILKCGFSFPRNINQDGIILNIGRIKFILWPIYVTNTRYIWIERINRHHKIEYFWFWQIWFFAWLIKRLEKLNRINQSDIFVSWPFDPPWSATPDLRALQCPSASFIGQSDLEPLTHTVWVIRYESVLIKKPLRSKLEWWSFNDRRGKYNWVFSASPGEFFIVRWFQTLRFMVQTNNKFNNSIISDHLSQFLFICKPLDDVVLRSNWFLLLFTEPYPYF